MAGGAGDVATIVTSDVEDGDDARVADPRHRGGLTRKAFELVVVHGLALPHELDRDGSIELGIDGIEHHPEATRAERTKEAVASEAWTLAAGGAPEESRLHFRLNGIDLERGRALLDASQRAAETRGG